MVDPYSDFGPLRYFGLNYTTFFLTAYPAPNHIATAPESMPKTIAPLYPNYSFDLRSLRLFCAYSSPIIGNCTIQMMGLGHSGAGSFRSITLFGKTEEDLYFTGTWKDMTSVTFRAFFNGNVTTGVGLRAADYAVNAGC